MSIRRCCYDDPSNRLCGRSSGILVVLLFCQTVGWAKPKKSGWVEVRSPHFIVDSNSGKATARATALQFEQIHDALRLALPQNPNAGEAPLTILAIDSEGALRRLLPGYFEKRGEAHPVGIFVDSPDGAFVVLRTDVERPGVFEPVYHEYTHFVMRQLIPGLPLWLSEGLADFFSNTRFEGPVILTGVPDAENLSVLQSQPLLPLTTLLAVDHSSPYYTRQDKVAMFYAESWALTHYLLTQDAARGTQHLDQYAAQVANGGDPIAVFIQIFGPLQRVDKALSQYVRHFAFPVLKFQSSEQLSAKAFTVRTLSPAEADADQAEFLLVNGRDGEAGVLIQDALEEDPNFGMADALKSALLLRQGDRKAAAELAEQAIKLDPNGYLGYFNLALAMDGGDPDNASAEAIEGNFERAIALRPSLVAAEVALSNLYSERSEKPERALALAIDAARWEPENTGVLTNLEVLLLKQQHQADAVRIELRMLGLAHNAKEKAMVRNNIGWAVLQENVAPTRADFEIRKAVQLDPESAEAIDSLGYLLKKEGNFSAAADAFRHALSLQPKLASSLDGLGDVLRAEHDWKGAENEYRAAIHVNAWDARAHYGLSLALHGEGNAADAAKEAAAAKSIDPFDSAY